METDPSTIRARISLAEFLRSQVPVKDGVVSDKKGQRRVVFFRGSKMVEIIKNSDNKKHGLDKITTDEEAVALCTELLNNPTPLFVRCNVEGEEDNYQVKPLAPSNSESKKFQVHNGRYYWVYEGHPTWQLVKLGALVFGIIAVCMFQLWPDWLKTAVWYVSVTLLLILSFLIILQLVVFTLCWVAGFEVWVVPNLWSDDVPIWELCSPAYTAKRGSPGLALYRGAVAAALLAAGVWVVQQSGDMESLVSTQKQFVEDLYSGALLSDTNSVGLSTGRSGYGGWSGGGRYGSRRSHIPDLDELSRMFGDEGEGAAGKASGEDSKASDAEGAEENLDEQDGSQGSGSGSGSTDSGEGQAEDGHEAAEHAAPDLDALLESHEEQEEQAVETEDA